MYLLSILKTDFVLEKSSFVREMAVLTDSTVILRLSLLQSETCEVYIPSLDFHIAAGTLGGRFTTLEGLLCNIKDQVRDTHLTLNIFYIAREIGVRVNTIGPNAEVLRK